jgi:hypothetical protein
MPGFVRFPDAIFLKPPEKIVSTAAFSFRGQTPREVNADLDQRRHTGSGVGRSSPIVQSRSCNKGGLCGRRSTGSSRSCASMKAAPVRTWGKSRTPNSSSCTRGKGSYLAYARIPACRLSIESTATTTAKPRLPMDGRTLSTPGRTLRDERWRSHTRLGEISACVQPSRVVLRYYFRERLGSKPVIEWSSDDQVPDDLL